MSEEQGQGSERRLEELFQLACELPREERGAFLDRHCAEDPDLRERLNRLLDRDDHTTGTLLREGALVQPAEETLGTIGRYTLLELIGEGGMGTVYRARQEEPVRRDVALKTLRIGTKSDEVVARFEAEFQALALMNHPGIAKVFDGGLSEAGMPFFVMEYVPGPRLDEYVDVRSLDLAQRLELFGLICEAVQHAHQKGVIHRDLKPSNILVVDREGRAQPKVIDFGIARALAGSLTTDPISYTQGRALGTFAYMSPEQADPRGRDLDTRVDIYALGVILYELLAGERPFSRTELEALGPKRALTALVEEEPPPPSVRLARLETERLQAIASRRGLSAHGLARRLEGDLDWIVMKALEKDRGRRYASASEFRLDIERHLTDEPVAAGPPTTTYRARKFLRRHLVAVSACALVFVSLAAGLTISALAWREAREARLAAERDLHEAQYQSGKAQAFVDYFEFALSVGHPMVSGRSDLSVRELFEQSTSILHELFPDRPEAEAAVRFIMGQSYLLLGEDDLALDELRRAYRLQEALLGSDSEHFDLMRTLMGLVQVTRRLGREAEEGRYVDLSLEKSKGILATWRPDLSDEVAILFEAALGRSDDPDQELVALHEILAAFPKRRSVEADALGRLVVQAALLGSAGPSALNELEARAEQLLGPENFRFLTFEWLLAAFHLGADPPRFEETLRIATRLEENAARLLSADHWLALEALRLEGIALAERWRSSHDAADLAAAEEHLLRAFEAVELRAGEKSLRLREVQSGLAQLCAILGEGEDLSTWLEESWRLWQAEPAPVRNSWWPASRPGLADRVRLEAQRVLGTGDGRDVSRHLGYAEARLRRYQRCLDQLDRVRSAAGSEDAVSEAFRALALYGLHREEEARRILAGLRDRVDAGPSELRSLIRELSALLGA